jgi:predicted metalloprotease
MRLDDIDPTENARDLGSGGGSFGGGGGGGLFNLIGFLPMIFGRKIGCGLMVVAAVVLIAFSFMGGGGEQPSSQPASSAGSGNAGGSSGACSDPARLEACRAMALNDRTWASIFSAANETYTPATINFYTNQVQSGCGSASSAVGPFYCPSDDGVYLDTAFFDELEKRFGAKGDFARIYVIAHEMGHHIQDLLGTSDEVSQREAKASEAEGNALSVRLELQADCYAGVWAGRNKDRLEPGDIEEGMTAANAIGDDTLQREAQGTVKPETFTHGTSAQRVKWLRTGLETGDPSKCDTFNGAI